MWSLIPVLCLMPELSCWAVFPPKIPPSQEGGVQSSGDHLRGSVLVLGEGLELCSRLAWFRTLRLHALPP
jgi:hypothetical protein